MVRLDAVNYLMGVLGSSPVASLPDANPDSVKANTALDAAVVSVTSTGFWFNELYNITLVPDPGTGEIDMTPYAKVITRNTYAVARNDRLFDPKNNTYVFEEDVIADAIVILDFDELPISVQDSVQFWAAVQLCTVDLEDNVKRAEMTDFFNTSFIQMKKEEMEIKRINRLSSPRVQLALYRVRPGRFNGRGGPNFGGR